MRARLAFLLVLLLCPASAAMGQNRIDTVTPLAPELAAYGPHAVGVRTLQVTDTDRPDILQTQPGAPTARADRTLTLEAWYPATLAAGQAPGGEYRVVSRDPSVVVSVRGQAVRDAEPVTTAGRFPLVIVSHGYPGNRYLLAHLGENLASKGYVVVAIDHKDSTYDDLQPFASTLYNRPRDQEFVLEAVARFARERSGSFLAGIVDADRTGLVGYSMGGYGVLNVVGAGFSVESETIQNGPPNRLLAERGAGNASYRAARDRRVKAAVAIAPWGMTRGVWDAEGLRGIATPVLFVAGSADEVAGYEAGTRAIFQGAVHADRYLLTFVNAGHNAGAPVPAPVEAYAYSPALKLFPFQHYADAVWDTVRMNNILDHFVTAFLDVQLKGDATRRAYLEVVPNGKDAVYAVDKDGQPTAAHTYWKGFRRGTAVGLVLEHAPAAQAPVRP